MCPTGTSRVGTMPAGTRVLLAAGDVGLGKRALLLLLRLGENG